ncbi:MAG: hypothetical protein R3B48_29650 [Kofleriaceae bacterium]
MPSGRARKLLVLSLVAGLASPLLTSCPHPSPLPQLLTVFQQKLLFEGFTIAEHPPSDYHPLDPVNDLGRPPLAVAGTTVKRATQLRSTDCGFPIDFEDQRCGVCVSPPLPNGHCRCRTANLERRMIELRGWLRRVDAFCADDQDARYDLELDPQWTDSLGLTDLNQIIQVGNVLLSTKPGDRGTDPPPASFRTALSRPIIHMELHPWRPAEHAEPPPPGWRPIEGFCPPPDVAGQNDGLWPYDPRQPLAFRPPLRVGQYVRVVGALITDDPHLDSGLVNKVDSPPCGAPGADDSRLDNTGLQVCDLNAVKHTWADDQFVFPLWVNQRCASDVGHPARYTELHPVDFIGVLEDDERSKPPVESVRVVALVAENGFPSGKRETLTFDLAPPGPRPPGAVLEVIEQIDHDLDHNSTHNITRHDDHVTIALAVRGDDDPLPPPPISCPAAPGPGGPIPVPCPIPPDLPTFGAKGKFKAVYRVRWRAP